MTRNKMKTKRKLVTTFIALLFIGDAIAAAISGKIIEKSSGEPLIGASIQIMGTAIGAITDIDGNFRLECAEGKHDFEIRYIGYEPVIIKSLEVNGEIELNFEMKESEINLGDITVICKLNRETESAQLLERRNSIIATQKIGAQEMSRKGIGDAQGAIAKMAGVAQSNGTKKVYIRGLGDRYNTTSLNNFVIPSENPEFKNISLNLFGSDIIQSIEANKSFASNQPYDVGGANINIESKEMVSDIRQMNASLSGGINTNSVGRIFFKPSGTNWFGITKKKLPNTEDDTKMGFLNQLNPTTGIAIINQNYSINGGREWRLERNNIISFFVAANYSNSRKIKSEISNNTTTTGEIIKAMNAMKYNEEQQHLLLGNAKWKNSNIELIYNYILIHSNNNFYGKYNGYSTSFNSGDGGGGIIIRQQINDNTLNIHQLISRWKISEGWKLEGGLNYNYVNGNEPDRRINTISNERGETQIDNWRYAKGDGKQQRYFSELSDMTISGQIIAKYSIKHGENRSKIEFGYRPRYTLNSFRATLFNTNILYSMPNANPDIIDLDNIFSQQNLDNEIFSLRTNSDKYRVEKKSHSGYINANYQINKRLTLNMGFALDYSKQTLDYSLNNEGNQGRSEIEKLYWLPSINLRYDITKKHNIRVSGSKTYTLPQAKELSPFRYYDTEFASEGNKDLKPSDIYNADFVWEYYPSATELVSATIFYKSITNPISRIDQANAASVLTYENIAPRAHVGGIEFEIRKHLFQKSNDAGNKHQLTIGLNASYIYSYAKNHLKGSTPLTGTALEGAAPSIANADITYLYTNKNYKFLNSIVFNYTSSRVYITGMQGYADTKQSANYTLYFVSSVDIKNHFTIKLKANNLIDPIHKLSRTSGNQHRIINAYRNGIDISVGISYKL